MEILKRLALQVQPIMRKRQLSVLLLQEFYHPDKPTQVGLSHPFLSADHLLKEPVLMMMEKGEGGRGGVPTCQAPQPFSCR